MPGRIPMKPSICSGLRRTSLVRSAAVRSVLFTIWAICSNESGGRFFCGVASWVFRSEAQHLLRLTAHIIGAIRRSAIRAVYDLGNLLKRKWWTILLRCRFLGVEENARADADCSQKAISCTFHSLLLPGHADLQDRRCGDLRWFQFSGQ